MEIYVWMLLAAVAVGFLAKTYWDVYQAWRAWVDSAGQIRPADLLAVPPARRSMLARGLAWATDRGDRVLHALLMSPISR